MKKNWGELESTTPSLIRFKVVPVLNKTYFFFCLPWPDMKILEEILFINASWHSRIQLPHRYIKRSEEGNSLLCINCQGNWYTFFPQKQGILDQLFPWQTYPLSISYMGSPGFSIMEGQNGIPFSGNNLSKSFHQKQVFPSQFTKSWSSM